MTAPGNTPATDDRCGARYDGVRCALTGDHNGPHQSHRDRDRAAVLWRDAAPGATR